MEILQIAAPGLCLKPLYLRTDRRLPSSGPPPLDALGVDFAGWLHAQASLLQRKVEGAGDGRVSIDVPALAALWNWSPADVSAAFVEAARFAGLAVGIAEDTTIDVMTPEAALSLLDAGLEVGEICHEGRPDA